MGRRTGVSALRNPGGAQLDVNWRGTSGCVFRAYPPAPVKKSLMGVCALALLGSTISSSLGRAPSEIPLPRVARLFYWYRAAPMLQGVSYVQNSAVYIRNLIPEEWDLTLFGVLGLSGRGYADLHAGVNFHFIEFSEVRVYSAVRRSASSW